MGTEPCLRSRCQHRPRRSWSQPICRPEPPHWCSMGGRALCTCRLAPCFCHTCSLRPLLPPPSSLAFHSAGGFTLGFCWFSCLSQCTCSPLLVLLNSVQRSVGLTCDCVRQSAAGASVPPGLPRWAGGDGPLRVSEQDGVQAELPGKFSGCPGHRQPLRFHQGH